MSRSRMALCGVWNNAFILIIFTCGIGQYPCAVHATRLHNERRLSNSLILNQSSVESLSEAMIFKVVNKASVPINLLALSAAVRAHGVDKNDIQPGQDRLIHANLGWYNLYVTTSEKNRFNKYEQVGWGLMKDGTAQAVGVVATTAVGTGVAGSWAASAGAAVTVGLASVVAPPVAAVGGAVALVGVGAASGLTVNAISETSFTLAENAYQALVREKLKLPDRPGGPMGPWGDIFRFTEVVTEDSTRKAFCEWYSLGCSSNYAALNNVVMSRATAEAYFYALQSKFSASKLSSNKARTFAITGGFTEPKQHDRIANLLMVEFVPLQIVEEKPDHGCNLPSSGSHWPDMLTKCISQCESEVRDVHRFVFRFDWCQRECEDLLKAPLAAERRTARRRMELKALEGQRVRIINDIDGILRSMRAAGLQALSADRIRIFLAGRSGQVKKFHSDSFAFTVHFAGITGSNEYIQEDLTLPAEIVQRFDRGIGFRDDPVIGPAERAELTSKLYGECWSTCDASYGIVSSVKSVGAWFGQSVGTWCHASANRVVDGRYKLHFGSVCTPMSEDHCMKVPQEPDDGSWYCAGECG